MVVDLKAYIHYKSKYVRKTWPSHPHVLIPNMELVPTLLGKLLGRFWIVAVGIWVHLATKALASGRRSEVKSVFQGSVQNSSSSTREMLTECKDNCVAPTLGQQFEEDPHLSLMVRYLQIFGHIV